MAVYYNLNNNNNNVYYIPGIQQGRHNIAFCAFNVWFNEQGKIDKPGELQELYLFSVVEFVY